MTTRLVDYVVIVGFDFESNQRNAKGRILQRFPEKDWPDTAFIEGIEFFCQPLGWEITQLSPEAHHLQKVAPKFFQFVLTDIDVDRHYCACLTFYEAVQNQLKDKEHAANHHHQQHLQQQQQQQQQQQSDTISFYAPKSIVLISRLDYKEVFKNCLSTLYSVHVDNLRYSLETLIGNLLTCVKVPSFGGPSIRFSLSAGDCLSLQPPKTETIPVTSTTVYRLIEHLGINNVVVLFYALLTEHKILFYSQSYTRLNEACQGLISLMYPFKYSHTYIPVLPATLIEFLSTPTPFIIGVHSSLKREISDLLDVIVVDFDGGSVKVPDSLHLAHLEEPYNSQLIALLIHITRPQITHADYAFGKPSQPSSPDLMDKEIRAIFLRTITQILQGYRSCLTVVRIHPKSLISFHKASFLGQRGFIDSEFMTRLLESMFFEKFVESRGLPHRDCDLFDELHANLHERLREEQNDMNAIIRHIKNLADALWNHENPTSGPLIQKALKPSEDNLISKPFPILDGEKVANILANETRKNSETLSEKSRTSTNDNQCSTAEFSNITQFGHVKREFVPMGLSAEQVRSQFNANEFVINSARRLEVMRNCVNCIFENKISDARKALPAVLKALKNKDNRIALIDELACHLGSQRAVLEHQQFDLVVRLMNCALQHESHIDLNGVAAKILPLAMEFCRRLCTGVIQFAFTCIQDHPVWSNQQFWEASFYLDVEKDIKALYGLKNRRSTSGEIDGQQGSTDLRSSPSSTSTINRTVVENLDDDDYCDSGLEVASKQLQLLEKLPESRRKDLVDRWSQDEESTVYSQAVHYANRIVCMKVPLDIATRASRGSQINGNENQPPVGGNLSQRTHSNGSDRNSNSDEESGFEDESNLGNFSNSEVAAGVVKFVTRFVDKVCIESYVGEDHIKALHQMIPQVVAMQIETLDSVYRESKRLPPVMKPKITNPDLIEGEELLMPGLRTYLLPDGRDKDNLKDESIGAQIGGLIYLPAEGAIFITNYRIIFKGRPCDPFYCEQTVVRSFPTATLTKEKRITVHAVPAVDQYLQEGLQLRSNTFQLLRIAFDEEVTSESIDGFRKCAIRQRSPEKIFQLFAFTSQLVIPNKSILLAQKTKNPKSATLKSFAKRTFMKTAQKAGLKKKDPNKNRYIFDGFAGSSKDSRTLAIGGSTASSSSISDHLRSNEQADSLNDSTSSDLSHHVNGHIAKSTIPRSTLGLTTSPTTHIKHVTSANTLVKMSQMNYVKDYFRLNLGNITTNSNNNNGNSSNIALSNFFQGSSTKHQRTSSNSSNNVDQCYITSLNLNYSVTRTYPALVVVPSGINDECIMRISRFYKSSRFPVVIWRHARTKALLMRSSGFQGKGVFDVFKKTAQVLYIMTEKALIKSIKPEMHRSCEFIPLDLHEVRQVKLNFVKFLRVCVPSGPLPPHDSEASFAKTIESIEWFEQLQTIMKTANSIVDLIDTQGKSVLLAIEEGWDLTPQITSIAQLCLDPYYRTFEGFRVLIEKEWLAFGHRFSHRSCHTLATPPSGFAPMFLQFLDIVHQIHRQFPLSFEFNQYYLKFIAYHSVSCRFRTFLLDCEAERAECGWLNEEVMSQSLAYQTIHGSSSGVSSGSNNSSTNVNIPVTGRHSRQSSEVSEISLNQGGGANQDQSSGKTASNSSSGGCSNKTLTPTQYNTIGTSFWTYAERLWNSSPIFFNYYYTPVNFLDPSKNVVLKPSSSIAIFKLWDYYTTEELIHGPSFDTEVFGMTRQHQEELQASADHSKATKRRLVVFNYDCIHLTQPDGLTQAMGDLKAIEHEYNLNPSQWSSLWSKIETSLPIN
jgi:myotubularin-related protein 5/13